MKGFMAGIEYCIFSDFTFFFFFCFCLISCIFSTEATTTTNTNNPLKGAAVRRTPICQLLVKEQHSLSEPGRKEQHKTTQVIIMRNFTKRK